MTGQNQIERFLYSGRFIDDVKLFLMRRFNSNFKLADFKHFSQIGTLNILSRSILAIDKQGK